MNRVIIKVGIPRKHHSPYILECNQCHKSFEMDCGKINYGKGGFFCSHACQARYFLAGREVWNKGLKGYMSGSKNGMWKGGKYIDGSGYVHIKAIDHPNKSQIGYVPEHRLVMEKCLGRYLDKQEIIHHKNGIKSDNRVENLELTTQSCHVGEHFCLNGKWAKHFDRCKRCRTTERRHQSKGLCYRCYRRVYYLSKHT
jgi:hypothetical protein